jgi:hypothetical protein
MSLLRSRLEKETIYFYFLENCMNETTANQTFQYGPLVHSDTLSKCIETNWCHDIRKKRNCKLRKGIIKVETRSYICNRYHDYFGGTQYRSLLRHYATSQKVAGSNSDEVIGFFNLPNPSSRTMALGSTQPARKAYNLTAICEQIV